MSLQAAGAKPVFTWESTKGNLHLYQEKEKYSLCFEGQDKQVIDIPKENIEGVLLDSLPAKVDEYCKNYFFQLLRKDSTVSIRFFESDVRDSFSPDDSPEKKGIGTIGFDFNSLEKKIGVEFSPKAPSYRRVCRGLNLEGKCANKVCIAFDKSVIVPKGIGTFRIAEELDDSKCPACDTVIPFTKMYNLGFWNCKFKIIGKQNTPEEKKVDREGEAKKTNYTTYKPGEECNWAYLNITTEIEEKRGGCTLL